MHHQHVPRAIVHRGADVIYVFLQFEDGLDLTVERPQLVAIGCQRSHLVCVALERGTRFVEGFHLVQVVFEAVSIHLSLSHQAHSLLHIVQLGLHRRLEACVHRRHFGFGHPLQVLHFVERFGPLGAHQHFSHMLDCNRLCRLGGQLRRLALRHARRRTGGRAGPSRPRHSAVVRRGHGHGSSRRRGWTATWIEPGRIYDWSVAAGDRPLRRGHPSGPPRSCGPRRRRHVADTRRGLSESHLPQPPRGRVPTLCTSLDHPLCTSTAPPLLCLSL
mmetsp:Transcript_13852/g.35626  ORF Transcript_13852/g.35626 Transcript_13852/m.35626 type:complete len:274 (-) Transcript_13852:51-872(-)